MITHFAFAAAEASEMVCIGTVTTRRALRRARLAGSAPLLLRSPKWVDGCWMTPLGIDRLSPQFCEPSDAWGGQQALTLHAAMYTFPEGERRAIVGEHNANAPRLRTCTAGRHLANPVRRSRRMILNMRYDDHRDKEVTLTALHTQPCIIDSPFILGEEKKE